MVEFYAVIWYDEIEIKFFPNWRKFKCVFCEEACSASQQRSACC